MTDILLITPDNVFFQKIRKFLERNKLSVVQTSNLTEAEALFSKRTYELILVDFATQELDAISMLAELQKRTISTPVVMIGEENDEAKGEEAIRNGAQDFIVKTTIDPKLFLRVIHYAIDRQMLLENLRSLSFTDELTGVYNRRGFFTFLEQQISLSQRLKKGFYLFFIDVDYLKEINDTFGHNMGDAALIEIAKCIKSAFRLYDVVGRLGGDEFAVIAINTPKSTEEYLKKHLIEKIAHANSKKDKMPFTLSLSIGATYFDPKETLSVDELLKRADDRLYEEKRHKTRI